MYIEADVEAKQQPHWTIWRGVCWMLMHLVEEIPTTLFILTTVSTGNVYNFSSTISIWALIARQNSPVLTLPWRVYFVLRHGFFKGENNITLYIKLRTLTFHSRYLLFSRNMRVTKVKCSVDALFPICPTGLRQPLKATWSVVTPRKVNFLFFTGKNRSPSSTNCLWEPRATLREKENKRKEKK